MDDNLDELVINVRANTDSFASDLKGISGAVDTSLGDGFEKAGSILEKSLLKALRKGTLGFDDLKNTALSALSEIAAAALSSGINALFGGSGSNGSGLESGLGSLFGQLTNSLFGAPGRATGAPFRLAAASLSGSAGLSSSFPHRLVESSRTLRLGAEGARSALRSNWRPRAVPLHLRPCSVLPAKSPAPSGALCRAVKRGLHYGVLAG